VKVTPPEVSLPQLQRFPSPRAPMAEPQNPLTNVELARASAWTPFREPLFRSLWIAAVISYTGTWMQNVGSGWLMTSLTMSPMMISLVQAATSLPVFLIALPAGALADMVDRRKLLLCTQFWMVGASAGLGVLTILGRVTPWTLLFFTFLLGFGAVMNDPAWQAITPQVVSEKEFTSAVALNSAGFNVARAIGPVLGGLVIAAAGSGFAFLLNAASFFGVIFFLYRWKNRPNPDPVPARRIFNALGAGFKYLRGAPAVQSVLLRTGLFSVFASALWALLPLIARPHGSIGYGLLLGSFGLGALAGACILPWMRRQMSVDMLVALSIVLFAVVTFGLGRVSDLHWLCGVLFAGGVSWISILASLNVSAQTMSPDWVRARSLSMYLLVLQGGMAAGSAFWGALASREGLSTTLLVASSGLLLGLVAARRHRLHDGSKVQFSAVAT
jgi:MFS family permease